VELSTVKLFLCWIPTCHFRYW